MIIDGQHVVFDCKPLPLTPRPWERRYQYQGGQLPPGRAGLGGFVRGATHLHRQRQQDVGVPGAIEAQRFIDFDIPPPHIDTRGMHTQQLPR